MLLALPAGKTVDIKAFTDDLVQAAGLYWPNEDQDYARRILQAAVAHMLIEPLEDFGAVKSNSTKTQIGRTTVSDMSSFALTAFGKMLLETC